MSMPGWNPPHRGPKGLVIGPLTGQISPAALGVAGALAEDGDAGVDAARILAASCWLAAWIAADSASAACSCAFATLSASVCLPRVFVNVLLDVRSSLCRTATCSRRALIRFASSAT